MTRWSALPFAFEAANVPTVVAPENRAGILAAVWAFHGESLLRVG